MKKYAGIIASSILASGFSVAHGEDVTAAKHIRAGAIVSASDIATPKDRDAMRRASGMIGLEAAHTLYKGQAIDEGDLRQPTLIKRNAIVQMEFSKGAMTILAEGSALDKGGMGDRIRVMNLLSKRIVTATVFSADLVKAKP